RAEIHRDGQIFEQEYSQGRPLYPTRVIGTTDKTGTTIHFKPDETIFSVTEFKYDTVASRLRELAFLNRGIKLTLTDFRELDEQGEPRKEEFRSEEHTSELQSRENLVCRLL